MIPKDRITVLLQRQGRDQQTADREIVISSRLLPMPVGGEMMSDQRGHRKMSASAGDRIAPQEIIDVFFALRPIFQRERGKDHQRGLRRKPVVVPEPAEGHGMRDLLKDGLIPFRFISLLAEVIVEEIMDDRHRFISAVADGLDR